MLLFSVTLNGGEILFPILAGNSGGITFINHSVSTGGPNAVSTPAVSTVGANFIAVCGSGFISTGATLTDSLSNTWQNLAAIGPDVNAAYSRCWYASPATGGASQTFTLSGTSITACIAMEAFAGVATSSVAETQAGAVISSASTWQPGSVTVVKAGDLLISTINPGGSATATINSSFTKTDLSAVVGATHFGIAMAYLITTTGSAVNPTWTITGPDSGTVLQNAWKAP